MTDHEIEGRLKKIFERADKLVFDYILEIAERIFPNGSPMTTYTVAMIIVTNVFLDFRELAEEYGADLPSMPAFPEVRGKHPVAKA